METLGKALIQLIKNLGIEGRVLEGQILGSWAVTVGKKIAEVTKAEKIEKKVLYIKVKNSTWRNEIFYLKKDIINKINKKFGKIVVEDIVLY